MTNQDDPLIAEIEKIELKKRRLKAEMIVLRDRLELIREEAERCKLVIREEEVEK